jgi:hypothetical protein
MTLKEFAKKWSISESKAKRMMPYIDGVTRCKSCNAYEIPDDAVAIYIPNKSHYSQRAKLYCYVLDAICRKMELNDSLSLITKQECNTIIKELIKHHLIILKDGCDEDSLNHLDYTTSFEVFEWERKKSAEKCEFVYNALALLINVSKTIANITKK